MKNKLLLLFICVLTSMVAYTQEIPRSKVPQEIRALFKKQFPTVKIITWELWKDGSNDPLSGASWPSMDYYMASFKLNRKSATSGYNKNNKWLKTEIEVSYASLPEALKKSIQKNFHGRDGKICKIRTSDKKTFYKVSAKEEETLESYTILFSESGEVIKRYSIGIAKN